MHNGALSSSVACWHISACSLITSVNRLKMGGVARRRYGGSFFGRVLRYVSRRELWGALFGALLLMFCPGKQVCVSCVSCVPCVRFDSDKYVTARISVRCVSHSPSMLSACVVDVALGEEKESCCVHLYVCLLYTTADERFFPIPNFEATAPLSRLFFFLFCHAHNTFTVGFGPVTLFSMG